MVDGRGRVARLLRMWVPIGFFLGLALFPFYWMAVTSLKPNAELYNTRMQYRSWISAAGPTDVAASTICAPWCATPSPAPLRCGVTALRGALVFRQPARGQIAFLQLALLGNGFADLQAQRVGIGPALPTGLKGVPGG